MATHLLMVQGYTEFECFRYPKSRPCKLLILRVLDVVFQQGFSVPPANGACCGQAGLSEPVCNQCADGSPLPHCLKPDLGDAALQHIWAGNSVGWQERTPGLCGARGPRATRLRCGLPSMLNPRVVVGAWDEFRTRARLHLVAVTSVGQRCVRGA